MACGLSALELDSEAPTLCCVKVSYFHLPPGGPLEWATPASPFKCIILIESTVALPWQAELSDFLIASGCRYAMAWGRDCSLWDDSIDYASLLRHDFKEVSEVEHVMTTWHDDESMDEVFQFSAFDARHPVLELTETLIVDITDIERRDEILSRYRKALET